MNKKYLQGYQDAADFRWDNLPLDNVYQIIDVYKERALKGGNEYFAGLAQRAEELVMNRVIPA
ncbi:hypothetical protein KL86SPO_50154 [uncultured Sporomusa sp.]|uniref:Uncharacterized protein n=1 Tax=uncultured Sporomusa sp. TaxID=307249 RepID=A0A212LXR2_9FIRM|nr:hypothetical protein [uncultured Sporomusa sp.]SCM82383.1 hypothetical protein KL86SPO_50154 [uncultured Sporomusa sp.]